MGGRPIHGPSVKKVQAKYKKKIKKNEAKRFFYNCSQYSIEKADLPVGGQPD